MIDLIDDETHGSNRKKNNFCYYSMGRRKLISGRIFKKYMSRLSEIYMMNPILCLQFRENKKNLMASINIKLVISLNESKRINKTIIICYEY